MNIQSDIAEVELAIEDALEKIEVMEAILRLSDNPDYKKLVLYGYCGEEAVRLTKCLNEVGMEEEQHHIKRMLESIADYHRYMRTRVQEGRAAKQALDAHRDTLDDLRAEL